jgi:UDPglucose 6-dehydrogenase
MLATRISFMNEMANLCEAVGADVNWVRKGIGADPRIGSQFLYPGTGYGGSCFPKDVKSIIHTGREFGTAMYILESVEAVNAAQKTILFSKMLSYFDGRLKGKRIAVWGLSFKPRTDDMREAPSVDTIRRLLNAGCQVTAYDPVATENARQILGDQINYADSQYDVLDGADCLVIFTEWSEFRSPDFNMMHDRMVSPVIFDGRNILNPDEVIESGFVYLGIGLPPITLG